MSRPRRTTSSDASIDRSDNGDFEENVRVSGRSLKSTRSRGTKEDKKPSVPRRDNSVGKPSSNRSLGKKSLSSRSLSKKSRNKDTAGGEGTTDKQPKKPGRRTRRVSPDSRTDEDDELTNASFHSVKKDSDKPRRRSRSSTSKKRTPTSSRKKAPAGAKLPRRKLKEKSSNNTDDTHETETSDDMDDDYIQEIKDDDTPAPESTRTRRERRKDRSSNGDTRKLKAGSTHGSRSNRSSLSSKRDGMRKSHSERWDRAVETAEGEEADNSPVVKRRSKASDGLSKSAHTTRVRRNNSSGLSRMKGSLNNRSYHGVERDHRSASGGKRTPKRQARRSHGGETLNSAGDESVKSFDTHSFHDGRSQATLESIEDYEDFGEDVYAMEMQTPGMIDFDQEMLDLMQRANPEVTDHLDRRVHRKREMVAFDQNMPMMTRQALLTRQASSQVQRQFIDGSTIDKQRLLLRNDSMGSSSHRSMRSALGGRRAPPRAKSSGLGAMGRGGFMDANREVDDRRRVFRSSSSQAASFNQYYQNKPNKVRNLSRRASGDLAPVHGQRPRSGEVRRRPVQRAASTTAIRRANSADHMSPLKPVRRMSEDKIEEDMDMSNKRNRSKLHFLMYKSKMKVDMDDLFTKVTEGESPRSPIDSLRMPSP